MMAYRVAATTLWIPMLQMQFHRTTLDGPPQVQMELLKLCGRSLVDWSLQTEPRVCGVRGLSAVMGWDGCISTHFEQDHHNTGDQTGRGIKAANQPGFPGENLTKDTKAEREGDWIRTKDSHCSDAGKSNLSTHSTARHLN